MISKISDTSDCDTQILFNTPWDDDTVRKVHIKIGKINDDTILKDIYNKNSKAFENLQNYAIKDTKAFYIVAAPAFGSFPGATVLSPPLFNPSKVFQEKSFEP